MNRNWLAAVLLAFAVLLAGCGGPNGGPGADTETEVIDGEETETEVLGDVTPTETPGVAVASGDVALPRAPDVGRLPAADG